VIEAFARLVAAAFQARCAAMPFVIAAEGDELFAKYLSAFPNGTDPLFKKRTEHDCSCCKQLIRRIGGVVTVGTDGGLETIWDYAAVEAPEPYRVVAWRMREVIRSSIIVDIFRVGPIEASFGAVESHSLDKETHRALTWNHLYTGEIPRGLRSAKADQERGDYRTAVQVFRRGLEELDHQAVHTVRSLIEAGILYRGEEHKPVVDQFIRAQAQFLAFADERSRSVFTWANASNPASRFRNTVIGTLVQDLTEGHELERAVKSFETKVAPQNYKRTTALITPGMVAKAMATIDELGLEPALERRFAVLGDISVNDVKWVDGNVRSSMKGGIGEALMKHAASAHTAEVDAERAEDIRLDDFVARVLPETNGIELFFSGAHVGNLMSLTAPVHPEPRQLFRWSNDFAWSYGGNVADSIKERVKAAGGRVEGALRVSLSWFNFDDLDLHVLEPPGRGIAGAFGHIYFGAKQGWTGGRLDVDMNAGTGSTRQPVENVIWPSAPPDGCYQIFVNNYTLREASDPGFVVEIECGGKVSHYTYNKGVRAGENVQVIALHMKAGVIERTEAGVPGITSSNISQEKWGLKTERYAKVALVTLSPNYWGSNAAGNKHTFFVLEGARNDEATRGFYNEFLHPRLEPHRKVFEVIADKTKCQPTEGQLSGLGFSSTKSDTFLVRAHQGKKRRIFNIRVGA
jgi:hypothetical protein